MAWKSYRRTGVTEMRLYIPGESLEGISVNDQDTPQEGGMIARNPDNPADQWYVNAEYFQQNMEEVAEESVS